MTSSNPICFTDSDDETREPTPEGLAVTLSRTTSSRSRSSEKKEITHVSPTVAPTAAPAATFEVGETSQHPRLRRTLRKTVGRLPTHRLAPRDEASSSSTRDIPCDVQRERTPGPPPLAWMTSILTRWRTLEGLPDVPAPSHAPITGEPIELTVPTLVGVCRTIFHILRGRHQEQLTMETDIMRLEQDAWATYQTLDAMITLWAADRARLEIVEVRLRVLWFVVALIISWVITKWLFGRFYPFFM